MIIDKFLFVLLLNVVFFIVFLGDRVIFDFDMFIELLLCFCNVYGGINELFLCSVLRNEFFFE